MYTRNPEVDHFCSIPGIMINNQHCQHDILFQLHDHLQVPQTPASLAQMSLAQRAEQAVLQERALEGQNEGHGGEPHTVTIVGSGAAGNGLASGGTIQVRGLGQMAAGATLQLAQLAGGQVSPHCNCT